MKLFAILPLLALSFIAASSVSAGVGQPAPELKATLMDGRAFDLKAEKGKVVIISFWATWCGPCRKEMPALDAYYKQHKAEGLDLIAVSMDDPANDKAVAKVMSAYSFPAALNRKSDYSGFGHVVHLPTAFVIDRNSIVRVDSSLSDEVFDPQKLDKAVTPLLNAKS